MEGICMFRNHNTGQDRYIATTYAEVHVLYVLSPFCLLSFKLTFFLILTFTDNVEDQQDVKFSKAKMKLKVSMLGL